jgi:hypothetical protein
MHGDNVVLERFGHAAGEILRSAASRQLAPGAGFLTPQGAGKLAELSFGELDDLVSGRRSTRRFGPTPVAVTDVVETCRSAQGWYSSFLEDSSRDPVGRWLIIAQAVEGVSPGIYSCEPDGLTWLAPLSGTADLQWAVQPELVSAPCILFPLWNASGPPGGDAVDGYLNLLVATGAGLYAGWLTALSRNLVACLFRGVEPSFLSARLGGGPSRSWSFLALAVGTPCDLDGGHR